MRNVFSRAALLALMLAACGGGSAPQTSAPKKVAGLDEDESATKAKTAALAVAKPKIDSTLIPEPGAPLNREEFSYSGGARDPFASVLEGGNIGPELGDLDLIAVYYIDANPSTSVAVLRDRVTNKNYSVTEGERVGRARVSNVRRQDVIFTVDDYGTPRQVTLTLRKREDSAQ